MRGVVSLIDRLTGEVVFDGHRVSLANPCPVCGKPDWCLYDPGSPMAICARVESSRQIGHDGCGWLHGQPPISRPPIRQIDSCIIKPADRVELDWSATMSIYRSRATRHVLSAAAASLGVTLGSLLSMGTGYDPHRDTLCWPMLDAHDQTIGIRLRRQSDGFKYAVSGSRNGLFVPPQSDERQPVFIVEGPTDTAAMLSIGIDAIGRPSCSSGVSLLVERLARTGRAAIVIADNDPPDEHGRRPGWDGAVKLAEALVRSCQWVKLITPPPKFKDARAWVRGGANKDSVLYRVRNT